ncbi:hypothetical protein ACQPZ8_23605 [Actinomadura nitritigenes]|uniref:hypothetical protein n=1 Tax=Actinomadura nitritigenes TaxID=134602 RepID=UPI003D8E5F93
MSGRVLAWAGVAVAVVAAVVLAVFWLVQGLEQAGWLAGVLSAFAALAAFVMALPLRPHPSAAAMSNTFSGGTNAGPLVMGRDISGPVTSGPPPPTPPTAPAPPSRTESGSAGSPESEDESADGTVSNTFSGGMNYGPLVMGRDISGAVTSHGTPAPGAAQPSPASPGPAEEPSDEAAGRASRDRPDDASAEA